MACPWAYCDAWGKSFVDLISKQAILLCPTKYVEASYKDINLHQEWSNVKEADNIMASLDFSLYGCSIHETTRFDIATNMVKR